MKTTTKNVQQDILRITLKIQKEYPELYKLLGETPLFLKNPPNFNSLNDFLQYLDSLQIQLADFKKNEQ